MENETKHKLEEWNKRMAIVTVIWACIGMPFIFLVNNNYLFLYAIGWIVWCNIGVFVAPHIILKIWKSI